MLRIVYMNKNDRTNGLGQLCISDRLSFSNILIGIEMGNLELNSK